MVCAEATRAQGGRTDVRTDARRPVRELILFLEWGREEDDVRAGVLRDISDRGIGFVTRASLKPGAILSVKIPESPHTLWTRVCARVVWCSRDRAGRLFLVGCHVI